MWESTKFTNLFVFSTAQKQFPSFSVYLTFSRPEVRDPKHSKNHIASISTSGDVGVLQHPQNMAISQKLVSPSSVEADRKILVAVDFGTTYSAIAWTQTRRPDVQEVITLWPTPFSQGNAGYSSDKVPTELRYEDGNGAMKWGFQILESQRRHQLFKLELDESKRYKRTSFAQNLPDPKALPPGYNITAEKLITDYLAALRKHTEQVLRHKIPASAFASTPIEYVVTVPAIWSDNAKAKTKSAAERAGMGKIHMVAEPEAGAVYALHALHPHTINIGDTIMLVDAGGGTVDVITYQVRQLQPMLQISEVTCGSGALCGSSFINRCFEDSLMNDCSLDTEWDEEVLEEASERFERVIKRSFAGVGNEEFQVPVPGMRDNPQKGIRRGKLRMTGVEVEGFFKPVVQETLTLIQDQIRAAECQVSTILLVGGFGQSQYLRSQIQKSIPNTNVMQSPQSWTAVVRGALMMGLASTSRDYQGVKITARMARKHYGYTLNRQFDPTKHSGDLKWWSDFHGEYRVNVMSWFLRKSDVVQEQSPMKQSFYKHLEVTRANLTDLQLEIHCCSDNENRGAPIYYPNGK